VACARDRTINSAKCAGNQNLKNFVEKILWSASPQ